MKYIIYCWSGANSKINKGLYVKLFKVVMLVTYIFEEGPWPAPITEHLRGRLWTQHCLPDSEWHDAEVTGMPMWDFPKPPFGK